MKSVELFAGAGGLALGCELAGFKSVKTVEWDRWACDTMRENQRAGYPLVASWQVIESDVRKVDWSDLDGPIDLVAGGPPCQPFSAAGKARAADDSRDMFPAAIEVIRKLKPKAFILENVRGLTRAAFQNYFTYIQLQLTHPSIVSKPAESWIDHLARLEAAHSRISETELVYNVIPTLVNAADYGVPQQRHRVFIVGFRSDLDAEMSFPRQTHSLDALLHDQWVTGRYWERHGLAVPQRPDNLDKRVRRLAALAQSEITELPWRTVRDATSDLPSPSLQGSADYLNHFLQPGARSYPGHTGSFIDLPAKALKAGAHGVPGGENMVRDETGQVRYFSVRESARLQTFPDRYELHGAWGEAMRQLGNAVPVLLAQKVAAKVAEHIALADFREIRKQSNESRSQSVRTMSA
jgi:DNA (cytosine-5)-methyltransferase 1